MDNEKDLTTHVMELLSSPKVRFLHEEFVEAHQEEIERTFLEPENKLRKCIPEEMEKNNPILLDARERRRRLSKRVHKKLMEAKINPRP